MKGNGSAFLCPIHGPCKAKGKRRNQVHRSFSCHLHGRSFLQSFFYFFIRHSCELKDAPDGEPKGDPGVSRDGQSSHESREAGLVVPDLWALEGQGIRNLQVYSSPPILSRSIALSHADHLHPILGSYLKAGIISPFVVKQAHFQHRNSPYPLSAHQYIEP